MRAVPAIGVLTAIVASVSCAGSGSVAAPTVPAPVPAATTTPAGPPAPLDGAIIRVTPAGFALQATGVNAQSFRVYQGTRLTFVNADVQSHDIMSDPFHIHTDCPEINVVGFMTPGQTKSTEPLNTIKSCGFHDHDHEGNDAWHGTVTVEAR